MSPCHQRSNVGWFRQDQCLAHGLSCACSRSAGWPASCAARLRRIT